MIIAKLSGGIGNQMFQYAIGRRLAHVFGAKLKLDTSFYSRQELRACSLENFNVIFDVATKAELYKLGIPANRFLAKFIRFLNKKGIYKNKHYIKEKLFRFDSTMINLPPDDYYIDGCWQNEKYFKDIKDIIRKEFTLKKPLDKRASQITKLIDGAPESISVHIRRGDYVSNKDISQVYNVCSLDYYNRAINFIIKFLKDPNLFIFSDDIEWVKNNLKTPHKTFYVSGEIIKDFEEIILMSRCRHHIIANSSFSWWGAWLGSNPDKKVVGPKKWANDPLADTIDVIPDSWIKI